jgi:Leucine Rich repeat
VKGNRAKGIETGPTQAGWFGKKRPSLPWVVGMAGGLLALVLGGIVLFWPTPQGLVKIESDDPSVEIVFDKAGPTVKGAGKEPITLWAGAHGVLVKRGDFEFETEKFVLTKGATTTLKVELLPGKIQLLQDGTVIGSRDLPPPWRSSRTTMPPTNGTVIGSRDLRPPPITPEEIDHRAAAAMLSLAGSVTIRMNDQDHSIEPGDDLPAATFKLIRVRLNGKSELSDAGLDPLRGLTNLVEVDFSGSKGITDACLERIQGLAQLEVLKLPETGITSAGLAHLHELKKLRELNLWRTQVTNAGLVHLQGLTQLESLNLGVTRVNGAGLADLQPLTRLRTLVLWDNDVKDAGLAYLKGLSQLESLTLVGIRMTDAGFWRLKGLSKLRHLSVGVCPGVTGAGFADPQGLAQLIWLDLQWTGVSDANLVYLRGLPRLESLSLYNTGVTDAGLAHLHGLTHLKELHLEDTKVTATGVEELKKALPSCRISSGLPAPATKPIDSSKNPADSGNSGRVFPGPLFPGQDERNAQPSKTLPVEQEEQGKPAKPKKPVRVEEEEPQPKSKLNRNEAPALPELAQEAEQATQPALRDFFRELAVPFDMVTWKDQAKRQSRVAPAYLGAKATQPAVVAPLSDHASAEPAPAIVAVNLRFCDAKGRIGSMIQVPIGDIERIDHYEEIAIGRVERFLDSSGRDAEKSLVLSEKLAAAEKVLAAVCRFHDSARDTGQRDGDGWTPLRDRLRKKLLDVQLKRLRTMVDGGEWMNALEYSSRLGRVYPESEVQAQLARSLGRMQDLLVEALIHDLSERKFEYRFYIGRELPNGRGPIHNEEPATHMQDLADLISRIQNNDKTTPQQKARAIVEKLNKKLGSEIQADHIKRDLLHLLEDPKKGYKRVLENASGMEIKKS